MISSPQHPGQAPVKLKCRPDDFCVEERTVFTPDGGDYALYRLTKRSLGTPEAIEALLRRWRIHRKQVAYGGLKDRHAVTAQYVTIRRGPHRGLKQTNLELTYLGQASRPFDAKDIGSNAFTIVLRDVAEQEVVAAREALHAASSDGLPNYFDDQRFGSVGQSGDFIARAWCAGDYERTLWLALADPNPHDCSQTRAQRTLLREHWGDWQGLEAQLRRTPWRDIMAHLVRHPTDFRGAVGKLRQDLRSLYLAAFQSLLWNRMLAELLQDRLTADLLVPIRVAGQPLPFPCGPESDALAGLRAVELPLPSARSRHDLEPWQEPVERALAPFGITVGQLRVKYPRDSFFSKGTRPALFVPSQVDCRIDRDELHGGRRKIVLACELPRGAYATILTKRIAAAAEAHLR